MANPPNDNSFDFIAAFRKAVDGFIRSTAAADTGGGPDGRPDRVVSREERIAQMQALLKDPEFLARFTTGAAAQTGDVGAILFQNKIEELVAALKAGDMSKLEGLARMANDLPRTLAGFASLTTYMTGTTGPDLSSGAITPEQIHAQLKEAGVDRIEDLTAADLRDHLVLPLAKVMLEAGKTAVPPR